MRILIDECLDWRLCRALSEHRCASVQQMLWGGLTNGKLLQKAQTEFDVFLTGDTNLSFQRNLTKFNIAVIVLEARRTRLTDTIQLMPEVLTMLTSIEPGHVIRIGPGSGRSCLRPQRIGSVPQFNLNRARVFGVVTFGPV